MKVSSLTPILNVSDMQASFEWFESIGWQIGFQWGEPVGFGSVCQSNDQSSDQNNDQSNDQSNDQGGCEIFLCLNGQGGRGKGSNTSTFGDGSDESADKGVWMSLWVDDVDAAFAQCSAAGIEITFPPTDMPWNVREMNIRHPDGHVFRVGHILSID